METWQILVTVGVPSGIFGFAVWLIERKIEQHERKRTGEATAKAVQRIPDAHCNGDMHAALDYASKVKHAQREVVSRCGIKSIVE